MFYSNENISSLQWCVYLFAFFFHLQVNFYFAHIQVLLYLDVSSLGVERVECSILVCQQVVLQHAM